MVQYWLLTNIRDKGATICALTSSEPNYLVYLENPTIPAHPLAKTESGTVELNVHPIGQSESDLTDVFTTSVIDLPQEWSSETNEQPTILDIVSSVKEILGWLINKNNTNGIVY